MRTEPYPNIFLDFDEKRHRFTIDGRQILSVTGATGMVDKSASLVPWAVGLARDYLSDKWRQNLNANEWNILILEACRQHTLAKERGGSVGKEVHSWAEQFLQGKEPPMPVDEQVRKGVEAFLKWIEQAKVKPIETEKHIYSKTFDYAGITDLIAEIDGRLAVVDFKTSKGLYNDYLYQIAAYRWAYEEMTGAKVKDVWLVRFDKNTGEFDPHLIDKFENARNWGAFYACLVLKRRELELKNE